MKILLLVLLWSQSCLGNIQVTLIRDGYHQGADFPINQSSDLMVWKFDGFQQFESDQPAIQLGYDVGCCWYGWLLVIWLCHLLAIGFCEKLQAISANPWAWNVNPTFTPLVFQVENCLSTCFSP